MSGRSCGNHRHGNSPLRRTMPATNVCSDLVGKPGRRTATLNINNHQRQFGDYSQVHRFQNFRQTPGPEVEVAASAPANEAPIAVAQPEIFVFTLNGSHTQ